MIVGSAPATVSSPPSGTGTSIMDERRLITAALP
jgi:hypothetical protein